MKAPNEKIYIRVLTDKNLGDYDFVKGFLNDWFDNFNHLAPERFAHGEPVNKKINIGNLNEIETEWQIPPSLMFKRISNPKFLFDLNWRANKGKDPRPYPWSVKVYLNHKHGKHYCREFFEFLIKWFEPVYGYITTESDESYKHNNALIPEYKNGQYLGKAQSYWGADITDKLPGLYWLTYISNRVLEPRLLKILDDITLSKNTDLGRIIQIYDDLESIGSSEAREAESKIAEKLGVDRFFNLDEFIENNDGERIV